MGSWVEKKPLENETILTKNECIDELVRLGREIWKAYRKYNPDGDCLVLEFNRKHLSGHNRFWNVDKVFPLEFKGRYIG